MKPNNGCFVESAMKGGTDVLALESGDSSLNDRNNNSCSFRYFLPAHSGSSELPMRASLGVFFKNSDLKSGDPARRLVNL